jgi:hypothetical protein
LQAPLCSNEAVGGARTGGGHSFKLTTLFRARRKRIVTAMGVDAPLAGGFGGVFFWGKTVEDGERSGP